jgi:phosphoribosyl-ATP pyrophosphohydrolase
MNKKDKIAIQALAQEGKQLAKIMDQDFPEYDYWEIYEAVHDGGGKSALGVKRTIANRLNELAVTRKKAERAEIIEEVEDLVWHLYNSLKASQRKLGAIRKTLDKQ